MNKKIFIFLFCLFIGSIVFAQHSFRITYEGGIKPSASFINTPSRFSRHIITDSSFYTFPVNSAKPEKKKLVYGEKIKHHSMYYFSKSNVYYYGNHWPLLSKPYLTKSSPRSTELKWIVDTTVTHYYKQYRCANAYRVNNQGDTIFVVYTPDIQYPERLNYNKGIPGVMLESFDSSTGHYSKVNSIEQGNFQVIIPPKAEIRLPVKDGK